MTLEGWRRLAGAIRSGDWIGAAMLASRPLGIARFDRMLILETRSIAVSPSSPGIGAGTDLVVRAAGEREVVALQRAFPHGASRYAGRFRCGDECLIVEQTGVLLGMAWVSADRESPMELGCRIRLPAGGWWEYDVFVAPEHRGRGLFALLMREMLARCANRGGTRLFAAVSHLNGVSLAAHRRLGYATSAVLDRFVLAGRSRHRATLPDGARIRLEAPGGGTPVLSLV